MAAVVAPAPPHPPVTPSTSPPASGDRERLKYSASQAAASGSTATRSAPSAAARCHRLSPSPLRPNQHCRGTTTRRQLADIAADQHHPAVSQKGAASVASTTARSWPPAAATILSASPREEVETRHQQDFRGLGGKPRPGHLSGFVAVDLSIAVSGPPDRPFAARRLRCPGAPCPHLSWLHLPFRGPALAGLPSRWLSPLRRWTGFRRRS